MKQAKNCKIWATRQWSLNRQFLAALFIFSQELNSFLSTEQCLAAIQYTTRAASNTFSPVNSLVHFRLASKFPRKEINEDISSTRLPTFHPLSSTRLSTFYPLTYAESMFHPLSQKLNFSVHPFTRCFLHKLLSMELLIYGLVCSA